MDYSSGSSGCSLIPACRFERHSVDTLPSGFDEATYLNCNPDVRKAKWMCACITWSGGNTKAGVIAEKLGL